MSGPSIGLYTVFDLSGLWIRFLTWLEDVLSAVLFGVGYSLKTCKKPGSQCSDCDGCSDCKSDNCQCKFNCPCKGNLTTIGLAIAATFGFIVLLLALKLYLPYDGLNSYLRRNLTRRPGPPS